MKVIYDAAYIDDIAIYLIYQINNKKVLLYLFKNEITGKFHIKVISTLLIYHKSCNIKRGNLLERSTSSGFISVMLIALRNRSPRIVLCFISSFFIL